ncbi:SnoaL-like protein [Aminobacter aminovorans]|uniref:SnoaL-like domain n=1 Tax=Aminobacter aminovorans TaxID=83263 RepID=A0A380WHI9_AMIAI|nr:nuclear transport factor 2 family protein [Aminobacter aminovorans]TCS28599.1 SnoaL-like protein [Aminobacter aminovorans]SUU88453.1 SnoaL-like domain [Aminobacter aminovorans]
MTDYNAITEAYIAAWNETDAAVRKGLVKATFAPGVSYRDPIMHGDGHDGINALIAGVHGQFPGFRFKLKGKADGFGDNVRFSWGLGPEGAEAVIEGSDFATLKDGRLSIVTGFLDKVPG